MSSDWKYRTIFRQRDKIRRMKQKEQKEEKGRLEHEKERARGST